MHINLQASGICKIKCLLNSLLSINRKTTNYVLFQNVFEHI